MSADTLRHRHRLTRHHGFIDGATAVEDLTVDWHALARPHAQGVAGGHLVEADVLVGAVRLDPARHLRGQVE
jgi:hypothetical protein